MGRALIVSAGASPNEYIPARRTDSAGQATVTLKIDLRSGTLLP